MGALWCKILPMTDHPRSSVKVVLISGCNRFSIWRAPNYLRLRLWLIGTQNGVWRSYTSPTFPAATSDRSVVGTSSPVSSCKPRRFP